MSKRKNIQKAIHLQHSAPQTVFWNVSTWIFILY